MGDDVETLQRALDALPADRVAHIKSLKEPWDKGVAKMKHWVGAEVVGICGASADELDFMKSLVRAAHEASCSLSSDGALHSCRTLPMNVTAKRRRTALLPMVVAAEAKKDLATPRTADSTMRHRLKKRGVRERKSIALQMTQAMRARMQKALPDNAAKKMRFIWNRVQQPMPKPPDLSSVLCGLCWATCSEYCPCGAEMVGSHDASALDEFGSFVFAPKNPMLRMWDLEDQRLLLASLRVSCENPRWKGFSKQNQLRGLAALCSLAGLTGRASTVERAGAACVSMNWRDLHAEIVDMIDAGMPIYRGGQHPGAIPTSDIATTVEAIDDAVGPLLVPSLMKLVGTWKHDLGERQLEHVNARRHGLLEITCTINDLAEKKIVRGISCYKCKRILEMLLMACYAGLAGLHAVPTDLRVVHGVYPLPANSLTALAAIFPKARSDMQKRYCLRLLQKTLKPGVLDVTMIVALLCFWTEEQGGKLQYMHEEGVVSLRERSSTR